MAAHQAVQETLATAAMANLQVLEASEVCNSGKKRKYTELEKQYAQAVADRDTWREVAHASQGASSSSQSLEDIMGDELEKELVAARDEAEFWKETLNAQELKKKGPTEEASVYAESETELWFNKDTDLQDIVEG